MKKCTVGVLTHFHPLGHRSCTPQTHFLHSHKGRPKNVPRRHFGEENVPGIHFGAENVPDRHFWTLKNVASTHFCPENVPWVHFRARNVSWRHFCGRCLQLTKNVSRTLRRGPKCLPSPARLSETFCSKDDSLLGSLNRSLTCECVPVR